MDGWVGHVGWPIADVWPTKWSSVQLAVWRRTGKVRRSKTSVLPLCYAANVKIWHLTYIINLLKWLFCYKTDIKNKIQFVMQRMHRFEISVHQKSFCGWAIRPDPLGSLQHSPRLPNCIAGEEEGKNEREGKEWRKGEGREGRLDPTQRIDWNNAMHCTSIAADLLLCMLCDRVRT